MQFAVLGPLRVTADGEEISVGPPRQQTLLAVLLLHRRRVLSAERLMDALWGYDPAGVAQGTLHAYISRLRRVLREHGGESVALETRRPGYVLYVADEDVDAARFERLAEEGRAALARDDPTAAAGVLHEALDLWDGAALAGLAEQSDLLAAEATRLEERRLTALEDRVDADLALARHEAVVGELEALVDAHPFRERLWGQLMLALYRAGRQAEALAWYQRASDRLVEELGIDPSEELQELQRRILRQDPELAPPAAPDAPPAVPEAFRLPAAREDLLGRDEEVAAVSKLVEQARLVTLSGPGGAGKTTLALHVGRLLESDFADGAVLVDLALAEDPRDVGATALTALGAKDHAEHGGLSGVCRALGDREVLLVLDNCEHVLEGAGELVDVVLTACPHVRVLATSRQPLGLHGEQQWLVPPLPVPPEDADREEAAGAPAVALFERRARALDARFRLAGEDIDVAARIVRELDGLPLAIELAAARLSSLSLEEVAAYLGERFRLLRGGPRTAHARHQALESTLAWSERLLTEREQTVLTRLAALPGGAGITTARVAFDGDVDDLTVVDVLEGLARKSLLIPQHSRPRSRYRMLETVRAYFLERLEQTEGSGPARRRLAHYLVELAEEAGQAMRGPDPTDALGRLDDELDNLAAVRGWALTEGDPALVFSLVTALPLVAEWRVRSRIYDLMEAAADAAEQLDHPDRPAVAAATAVARIVRGDADRAHAQLELALDQLPHGHPLRATAWLFRVHVAVMVGETGTAVAAARAGLEEIGAFGDQFLQAFARSSLALALVMAGRRDEALDELACLHAPVDEQGSVSLAAWCAYVHGEALGDDAPAEAEQQYRRAVDLSRRSGADTVTGIALIGLSSLEARHGEPERALPVFAEALAHHLRGSRWQECWTALTNLTDLFGRLGEHEAALEILGAADSSATCPPVYGEAAQRREAVLARAREALGSRAAQDAWARGADRDDVTTVRTALQRIAALDQASHEPTHEPPAAARIRPPSELRSP